MIISSQQFIIIAITLFVATSLSTYLLTRILIVYLVRRNLVVADFHKTGKPMIPKPGGPSIIISILVSEMALYLLFRDNRILAIILTLAIVGAIGLVDDFRRLSGKMKPGLLLLGSLPILLIPSSYSPFPAFPFFGTVRLTIVYPVLVFIAISVSSNTVNTIDVLNGVVSGFTALVSIPILFALTLKSELIVAAATVPLLASAIGFYFLHRFPSKIFPGDSGSLVFGAMIGASAIAGGVEIVTIIALLPAILNSFFFLSSVKRFVEHRKLQERPVQVREDGKLIASKDSSAPITLVRMVLAEGEMTEKQVASSILKLTAYAALLAAITAITIWVIR